MTDNSIEYAKMIEIPTSSCEYVFKRKKRFFNKKSLIKKVNQDIDQNSTDSDGDFCETANGLNACDNCNQNSENCNGDVNDLVLKSKPDKKEKVKSNIIKAQIIAVFALSVAIILTNVFWENSGMNQLFKSVFSTDAKTQDDRTYQDFSLNLPVKSEGVTLLDGVLYIEGEYSVYPVCEGSIKSVTRANDGSFTVTVYHSESFSSVIEGADFVYFAEGDKVNANVPVCHTSKSAKIYLYDNGTLLTDYLAIENSIVFNK